MGLSFVWCLVRATLAFRFVTSHQLAPVLLGALELFAVLVTTVNLIFRNTAPIGWRSHLVPFFYLLPLLLTTGKPSSALSSTALLCAVLLQTALRVRMCAEISISVPMACKLLSKGIYGRIRHPLAASSILVTALLVATYPCARNLLLLPVLVAAEVAATIIEEHYLLRSSIGYADYQKLVPWRFWPKIA